MRNAKGQFVKGHPPENGGFKTGHIPWCKGKENPKLKGHPFWGGPEAGFKKGHPDLVPKESRGHTDETRAKMKIANSAKAWKTAGERNWRWIKDRTKVKLDKERGGPLHKQWSMEVKKRDGWKCRIADENCSGKVVAHHILSWRDFVELRYKTNNGITLCHAHHPRKRADEARLSPFFQELVAKGN